MPQLLLFAGFAAWYFGSGALAASSASGLAARLKLGEGRGLLEACFHLFLLVLGFLALQTIARKVIPFRELAGLPARETATREWLVGGAVGWGVVVVALLPLALSGRLRLQIGLEWRGVAAAVLAIGALGVAALAHEITFRGYPFRCLIGALGQAPAVILMMLLAAFSTWRNPYGSRSGMLASMLLTLLLSLGALRTRAIWLPWGLHFALAGSMGVLFGLPLAGDRSVYATALQSSGGVIQGLVYGPDWLTGGDFGPGAALFSLIVLVAAIVVLYRMTRDYAWQYTHAPIVAGGYEVVVAPPAAHAAMEQKAPATPALVQILSTTPQSISAGSTSVPPPPPPPVPDRLH